MLLSSESLQRYMHRMIFKDRDKTGTDLDDIKSGDSQPDDGKLVDIGV